jgi:hypothetical protein
MDAEQKLADDMRADVLFQRTLNLRLKRAVLLG